jgi:hypothetical protein
VLVLQEALASDHIHRKICLQVGSQNYIWDTVIEVSRRTHDKICVSPDFLSDIQGTASNAPRRNKGKKLFVE